MDSAIQVAQGALHSAIADSIVRKYDRQIKRLEATVKRYEAPVRMEKISITKKRNWEIMARLIGGEKGSALALEYGISKQSIAIIKREYLRSRELFWQAARYSDIVETVQRMLVRYPDIHNVDFDRLRFLLERIATN